MDAQTEGAVEPDLETLRLAYTYIFSDPARAMADFCTLANAGSLRSLAYIGYLYESGLGVEPSLSNADIFYRRAFARGSASGAFGLGSTSWKRGDYKKAEEYFTWGVEKDDPRAMYWLTELYRRGHVHRENWLNAAVEPLEHASALGHLQSRRKLGWYLMTGHFGIAKFFQGLWLYCSTLWIALRLLLFDPASDRLADLPIPPSDLHELFDLHRKRLLKKRKNSLAK